MVICPRSAIAVKIAPRNMPLSRKIVLLLCAGVCNDDIDRHEFVNLFLTPIEAEFQREELRVRCCSNAFLTPFPLIANSIGLRMLPVKPGSCTNRCPVRCPGIERCDRKMPRLRSAASQTSCRCRRVLPTLWNNDEGYSKAYLARFSGYYLTADAGTKTRMAILG